jgi:hypothetical protein
VLIKAHHGGTVTDQWLAGRGITLEVEPALPAGLTTALAAGRTERLAKAAAAHEERLAKVAASHRVSFANGLRAWWDHEARSLELRGCTDEAALVKAAAADAPSILDIARAIPGEIAGIPAPDPNRPDRREEIRALAARQRSFGNFEGALTTEKALIHEEALALARESRAFIGSRSAPAA